MPPPAVKCSVFVGIFGEYDSSCNGGDMSPPYNGMCKQNDKSEFNQCVQTGLDINSHYVTAWKSVRQLFSASRHGKLTFSVFFTVRFRAVHTPLCGTLDTAMEFTSQFGRLNAPLRFRCCKFPSVSELILSILLPLIHLIFAQIIHRNSLLSF